MTSAKMSVLALCRLLSKLFVVMCHSCIVCNLYYFYCIWIYIYLEIICAFIFAKLRHEISNYLYQIQYTNLPLMQSLLKYAELQIGGKYNSGFTTLARYKNRIL